MDRSYVTNNGNTVNSNFPMIHHAYNIGNIVTKSFDSKKTKIIFEIFAVFLAASELCLKLSQIAVKLISMLLFLFPMNVC